MNKIIILSFLLTLGFISCKTSEKQINNIEIAKDFYTVLNNYNYSTIPLLIKDSILTKEGSYKKTFSQHDFIEILKWDSIFKPEYTILKIEEENGVVKARISKKDKRILFLHEAPIVTNEVITFSEGKIKSVEITDYAVFNDTVFSKNRSKLLSWIDENHPELNGFIHDQTKTGGLKYLKALDFYEKAHQNTTSNSVK